VYAALFAIAALVFTIIIAELVVVIAFTALRRKVSPLVAKILFLIYAALSGLTLSSIFLVYKISSIGMVFLSSAIMFGLLALYGYTTKTDLTSFGKLLLFGLLAIIIMSIINIFVGNGSFGIIISIASVVIFLGLTAWDMQKLKMLYNYYSSDETELSKFTIYGALDLYLDFINIFLQLLNLFGKRRD
jgi:FtsH-binding integral membrane protein